MADEVIDYDVDGGIGIERRFDETAKKAYMDIKMSSLTEKTELHDDDMVLLEDSEDSGAIKKAKKSLLAGASESSSISSQFQTMVLDFNKGPLEIIATDDSLKCPVLPGMRIEQFYASITTVSGDSLYLKIYVNGTLRLMNGYDMIIVAGAYTSNATKAGASYFEEGDMLEFRVSYAANCTACDLKIHLLYSLDFDVPSLSIGTLEDMTVDDPSSNGHPHQICAIDSETAFIAYKDPTTYGLYGALVDYSVTTPVFGTGVALVSATSPYCINVCKITESTVLVAYQHYGSGYYCKALICDITGGTLTPGAVVTINAAATYEISAVVLSSTRALISYIDGNYTHVRALSLSGSTIDAIGSALQISNENDNEFTALCRLSETTALISHEDYQSTNGNCGVSLLSLSDMTVTNKYTNNDFGFYNTLKAHIEPINASTAIFAMVSASSNKTLLGIVNIEDETIEISDSFTFYIYFGTEANSPYSCLTVCSDDKAILFCQNSQAQSTWQAILLDTATGKLYTKTGVSPTYDTIRAPSIATLDSTHAALTYYEYDTDHYDLKTCELTIG